MKVLNFIDNNYVYLHSYYPKTFNPSTTIKYNSPSVISNERSDVRNLKDFSSQASINDNVYVALKVYDILGREVAPL